MRKPNDVMMKTGRVARLVVCSAMLGAALPTMALAIGGASGAAIDYQVQGKLGESMTPAGMMNGVDVFYGYDGMKPEEWYPEEAGKRPFVVVSPKIRANRLKALVSYVLEEHRSLSKFKEQHKAAYCDALSHSGQGLPLNPA